MKWFAAALCLTTVSSLTLADSLNCREIGSWPYDRCGVVACDEERDLIFLSSGTAELVLDASDPARPQRRSDAIRTLGIAADLCYRDSLLFVADNEAWAGSSWLEIWDITSPDLPTRLGFCSLTGDACGLAVVESLAYVAAYFGGLRIINIADPQHPQEVGCCSIPTTEPFEDVAVNDTLAYIADYNHGLRIINVADPRNPFQVGFLSGKASRVAHVDSIAYLATPDGLRTVSVANPQDPRELGYLALHLNNPRSMVSLDTFVYLSENDSGTYVINVADPDSPYEVAHHPQWFHVAVDETLGYMVLPDSGLDVVGMADPTNPQELGSFSLPWYGNPEDLVVADSLAFVACRYVGMLILNVADPQNPREVGFFAAPGPNYGILDIAIVDTLACIEHETSGLRFVSVADPQNPREVGSHTSCRAGHLAAQDSFAYLSDGDTMRIVNFADPAHPYETGNLYVPTVLDVAASDSFVYVTSWDSGGLYVINVADPHNPQQTGHCGSWQTWCITSCDSFVYAVHDSALYVINVADPRNPYDAGSCPVEGTVYGMDADGGFAYLAAYWREGLQVVNVADPSDPYVAGHYNTPGMATGVGASGGLAYVADFFCGVRVIEFSGAGLEETVKPERTTASCDPTIVREVLFQPETSSHKLQAASLLDAAGRKVMDLAPGANDVRALAPGVYFIREGLGTRGEGLGRTRKVVVTR